MKNGHTNNYELSLWNKSKFFRSTCKNFKNAALNPLFYHKLTTTKNKMLQRESGFAKEISFQKRVLQGFETFQNL